MRTANWIKLEKKLNRINELCQVIENAERELEAILGGSAPKPVNSVKKPAAQKKGHVRVCSLCNKPGHRKDKCEQMAPFERYQPPSHGPDDEESNDRPRKTADDIDAMTFASVREAIKERGQTSKQVAEEMDIPLTLVNEMIGYSSFLTFRSANK